MCWCKWVIYSSLSETCFVFVLPSYIHTCKCIIHWMMLTLCSTKMTSEHLLSANLTTPEYVFGLPNAKITAFTVFTFFLSILLQNDIFLKTKSGYYHFIVLLWDDYETNLHFIFVWTTEYKKITQKCPTFLVRHRPPVVFTIDVTSFFFHVERVWPSFTHNLHFVSYRRDEEPTCSTMHVGL